MTDSLRASATTAGRPSIAASQQLLRRRAHSSHGGDGDAAGNASDVLNSLPKPQWGGLNTNESPMGAAAALLAIAVDAHPAQADDGGGGGGGDTATAAGDAPPTSASAAAAAADDDGKPRGEMARVLEWTSSPPPTKSRVHHSIRHHSACSASLAPLHPSAGARWVHMV